MWGQLIVCFLPLNPQVSHHRVEELELEPMLCQALVLVRLLTLCPEKKKKAGKLYCYHTCKNFAPCPASYPAEDTANTPEYNVPESPLLSCAHNNTASIQHRPILKSLASVP